MKQRLAARRQAEKREKENTALEQEMIRKEKELVAMKAQLMLKRAAFMKSKAKKLKDQAQENSQQKEGGDAVGQGSTSARGGRSRGGSRGGARRKAGVGVGADGRTGSGSAPTTARDTPTKHQKKHRQQQQQQQQVRKEQQQHTPYDVHDPLALDSLQLPPRQKEAHMPDEDWDWHTPRAVGSGKSAISDLRRSKYSPILHKREGATDHW